jgi:hypothetical protein
MSKSKAAIRILILARNEVMIPDSKSILPEIVTY